MINKKMDPVDLPIKFNRENIDDFLNPPNKPSRSLTRAVVSPIYHAANSYNQIEKLSGHKERIIMMVLPITPEIEEAADGFSLKKHTIDACRAVVKNEGFSHG